MKRILFVTTNKAKIEDAKQKLKSAGIEIVQSKIKVQELKHPNVRKVVRDKAKKSFNTIKKSLIVEDSALYIPALGEFPGTQVKKAFGKLSLQDISKLLQGKKRDVKFVSALAYADKKEIKVFTHTYSGKFAKTPAGKKQGDGGYLNFLYQEAQKKPVLKWAMRNLSTSLQRWKGAIIMNNF